MDEQVQNSIPPEFQQMPKLSAEQVEMLKAVARERAIAQVQTQRLAVPPPSMVPPQVQTQVVYVRRNFTVAELLLILLLSCGLVAGAQALWGIGARILPQVEIKVK
jgi:hypothetical protein